jgi:hypothetical protein
MAATPVLAKHSKHFSLEDALSIGVDRMQRDPRIFQQFEQLAEARPQKFLSRGAAAGMNA